MGFEQSLYAQAQLGITGTFSIENSVSLYSGFDFNRRQEDGLNAVRID